MGITGGHASREKSWSDCLTDNYSFIDSINRARRLSWPEAGDFSCGGGFTVSDIWPLIMWHWTWLGDALLMWKPINTFFELPSMVVGHSFSIILMWVLVAYVVFKFYRNT